MRSALSAFSFAALVTLAPACDSSEDTGNDFRGSLDVNIQMTMADGGSDDGSIVWEIVEAEVYEGLELDGQLHLFIENNAIYDAAGEKTCEVDSPALHSSRREVIAANGEVLFTVWRNFVFEGTVDVEVEKFDQVKKRFSDQLLFQYEPHEIFLGEANDGVRLMTTNTDITAQSEGRKLLMAALMTGKCGASGLPGYTF
ncbi:hypothetical protein ENSA5_61030 [Enhygromyxa salina]|uniref:Lipoprotein n=1 Tax=Enhygromyxa salina TaxID=215803 RepID=A0A2S9XDC4_9BACT|nr:hypothetical protein [Enhygromyxa salina]PRP90853.1 hypothetical protein ENSA5_61030 [Enhygromyxa salina]